MESESPSNLITCPLCDISQSKDTFSVHLETHSKQSLIEMLLQQQEALQTIKPSSSSRGHHSATNNYGRKSPSKKLYQSSHTTPSTSSKSNSGSSRRQNKSGHQRTNEISCSDNNFLNYTRFTDLNRYGQEIISDHTDQIHPIENIETIEQVQGEHVILYQLELHNIDELNQDNNCIPFTTVEPAQDPLHVELEHVEVHQENQRSLNKSNVTHPKVIGQAHEHWIFSGSETAPISDASSSIDMKHVVVDDSISNDHSSSNNTHSQGAVNLMTDEELPPRGEISEYEESRSNASSFHSANDEVSNQRGSLGPSLGSLFSDVRRVSPIAVENDSFSSMSKKRKRKPKSQTSPIISAVKANPDGLICLDCKETKYFRSIFELAQHQAEAHPETYKSFSKQIEQNSSNTSSLPWASIDRAIIPKREIDSLEPIPISPKKPRTGYSKQYACLYCNFIGAQKTSLTAHMNAEHPTIKQQSTILFECRNCGRICKSRSSLVKHLLIHNGKKHSCPFCLKKFTSNFKLKEHERVHTKDYPFNCEACGKQFRTPSLRTIHVKKVHLGEVSLKPKPEFYCKICCRILRSKKSLQNHMETHLEKKIQKCPHCPETFQKHRVLVRHIRSSHDPAYAAKESKDCPVCFKKLHPNSMRSHMRIHNKEKPYACPMCSLTFRTYSNLASHSWSHTNVDKPYKCNQCSKSYLFKKVLEAHQMVHKRRTFHFVCNECGVKFTSKANMKRHVQEHYTDKKFKCKVCSKTFHRNYYLVEHERIHTGTKLFSCSICGKSSSTKSNHRAHVKIHDARESGTLEG